MYNETAQLRYKLLVELEKETGAKIITLVGISTSSRLDDQAASKVIRNLQRVGVNTEAIIYLNTIGGEIGAGWKIAREILGRQAKTTIIVTNVAKSTGTLISLAGTEIIARKQSEFGPTDPRVQVIRSGQAVYLPALSLLDSDDEVERLQAEYAIRVTKDYLRTILGNKIQDNKKVNELLAILLRENAELKKGSHSVPFFPEYFRELGLNVTIDSLTKFCDLYALYLNDSERILLEQGTHLVEMSIF